MRISWRKFRELPPFQRAIAVRAVALLPVVAIMLRVFGLRRSVRVSGWLSGSKPLSDAPAEGHLRPLAETIANTVQAVARRHPLPSSCLSRSLVSWSLLRRWGIDSQLRIGVNKQAGSFEAHAWVEHRGQPLGNDKKCSKQYVALDRAITAGT
jgi:hypothetical protein